MRFNHFLTAILLAASTQAPAAALRNLYQASVPVADQGAEARGPALRAAFETVLVRVTGTRPLAPEAAALLARAADLAQGYGYETPPDGGALRLHASFDARAVDAALRAQNLRVWGANRPYHLAWIAVRDDNPPRQLLDGGNAHGGTVAAVAEARGLPLNFPALDAAERQSVNFNTVWDSDIPALRQASRRYASEALVVGRVDREGGSWVGHWTLLPNAGAVEEWSESRETLDAALTAGIDALADREAASFAVETGRNQELHIAVSGVQTVKDYGRTLNYLRSLAAARSVQVESAQGDRLTFRVRAEGDPAALGRVIASGSVLRGADAVLGGVDQAYVLVTQ